MTTKGINSKSPTIRRILREASELSNSPSPDFQALPTETDLFTWHFTLRGPPSSPYSSGIYHGRIVLPPTYPLRPPSFRFLTPSGRFEVNREICLSISGHHEETWMPAWGVRTALVALRSFLETPAAGQVGGLDTSDATRAQLAEKSRGWSCQGCGKSNEEILAETAEAAMKLEAEGRAKKEDEVPEELKLGYREDLSRGPGQAQGKSAAATTQGQADPGGDTKNTEDTEAELAEGFVQTGPPPADLPVQQSTNPYPPAQPGQTLPAPTGSTPSFASAPAQISAREVLLQQATQNAVWAQQQMHAQHQAQGGDWSNDGVPVWVDRAILGIVAALVVMILKLVLGL